MPKSMKEKGPPKAKATPSAAVERLVELCVDELNLGPDGGFSAKPWAAIQAQFSQLQAGGEHKVALEELMYLSQYLKSLNHMRGAVQLWELGEASLQFLEKESRKGWAK